MSSISSRRFNLSNPSLSKYRILCLSLQSRLSSISCLIVDLSSPVNINRRSGYAMEIYKRAHPSWELSTQGYMAFHTLQDINIERKCNMQMNNAFEIC